MGVDNLVQRGQRHRLLEIEGKVDKQTEIASHGGCEGELGQNQGDPNLKPPIAEVRRVRRGRRRGRLPSRMEEITGPWGQKPQDGHRPIEWK